MKLARSIYYALPPSFRFAARRIWYFPVDIIRSRKSNSMIPPRGLIFIGSGDFVKQGQRLAKLLIDYAGLKPDGKILDVGCGIGRLAIPLTKYLNDDGRYDGFDIVERGIRWCNKRIKPLHPNFNFLYVGLKNDLYNLATSEEAKNFIFPYPENYYDCIALTSVFTHMTPDDVDNYLKQIASVMKKDGKCLATFFLLNPEVEQQIDRDATAFAFSYKYEGYSLMNQKVKEANIAFEEPYLLSLLAKNGLKAQSIYQGSWSNGPSPLDFQDVVIITHI